MKSILLLFFFFCTAHYMHAATTEKAMVILITSYNNSAWYAKNLDSVYSQNYTNYRVIYIDDCSCDSTYELVTNYAQKHQQEYRTLIHRNNVRKHGALPNFYYAIHTWCLDTDIIVNLDGDDWFENPHVLERINKEYQDPTVWLTYGQMIVYPSGEKNYCKKLPDYVHTTRSYRNHFPWVTSHLRTFYAKLFKKINIQDLFYQNDFYIYLTDMPMMYPMLEMASNGHIRFIPDILYVYNTSTAHAQNSTNKIYPSTQMLVAHCKSQPRYNALATLFNE